MTVLFLHEISESDLSRVGGKAANLAKTYKLGLPVPEAFVITSDDTLVGPNIAEAYRQLSNNEKLPVAVRSSSAEEDSGTHSFAGQFISILNVKSEIALWDAIRACLESSSSPRVIAYRAKLNLTAAPTMAIIVQKQIASEKAGVCFTADPITEDTSVLHIDSVWGQGEPLVSGNCTPDSFVLRKSDGTLISSRISTKSTMKLLNPHGWLADYEVPDDKKYAPSLTLSELDLIWDLAQRLLKIYNEPQDFEWAFSDGTLWLLQTRPITKSLNTA